MSGEQQFLGPEATPELLVRATAENHLDRFTSIALSGGGEVRTSDGLTLILAPDEINFAFPALPATSAGALLDAAVDECRQRKPKQVACWSLLPTQPHDLGARLAARGFEWGWQPHWMALELSRLNEDIPVPPGDLRIEIAEEGEVWEVEDLPYYNRPTAAASSAPQKDTRNEWRFGAWQDGKIVGQCTLHITTGPHGVAGIYNVGVVPAARNRGIGRAITLAACRFAREHTGCRWATLNAAVSLYNRLGFRTIGWGQTWWMHAPALEAPPPSPAQIAFAEAIGQSDIPTLDTLANSSDLPNAPNAPLPCGLTPMGLAVKTKQPATAEWLIERGAPLGLLDAWELGWSERILRMLATDPGLINRRSGAWGTAPLHVAVQNNDVELVRWILAHTRPDQSVCDTQFNGTPLGWARHFGRTEIIALLEGQ